MIFRYLIYLLVIIFISYGATKALRYEAKTYAKILTLDEVGNLYTLLWKKKLLRNVQTFLPLEVTLNLWSFLK